MGQKPDYLAWNQAIVDYFTQGLAAGAPVYLNLNTANCHEIGQQEWGLSGHDWEADLIAAIQSYVIQAGKIEQDFLALPLSDPAAPPRGVAWLAFQVLAASKMRRDEQSNLNNYYKRLAELLGMSEKSKPNSFKYDDTWGLWQQWNRWLLNQGWQATARQGVSRKNRYVHLPISQCVLRQGEGEQVMQIWHEQEVRPNWTRAELIQWLSQQAPQYKISKRLHQSLSAGDSPELYDSLYRLYQDRDWQHQASLGRRARRTLEAGLYRLENFLDDSVSYRLYIKQRGRLSDSEPLQIVLSDHEQEPLIVQRPGWYQPLVFAPPVLDQHLQWTLNGSEQLQAVSFPGADVWAFVRDPLQPELGQFASWGRPTPGEDFIILIKDSLSPQLEWMQAQQMISWEHVFPRLIDGQKWQEYYGCVLHSQAPERWKHLYQRSLALWDCLHPVSQIQLVTLEGLRANHAGQQGYLFDFPPQLKLLAPAGDYQLRLQHSDQTPSGPDRPIQPEVPLTLDWPTAGLWQITILEGEDQSVVCEKQIRLLNWDELSLPLPNRNFVYQMENGQQMRGGLISDD